MNPQAEPLRPAQIRYLRGLGQRLKPSLHVGHQGVTAGTGPALDELLTHRELVKVRVLPSAELPAREAAAALATASGAALIGIVGHTFVLYRPNPKLKAPIRLPGE